MLKFVVFSALVVCCTAYGSGGYGSNSGSSGSSLGGFSSGGYGSSGGQGGGQVIKAAVQTRHTVDYYDVPSSGSVQPTTIEVDAGQIALNILFKSASSNLNIQQVHDGAQGSTQETSSEDEPHVLKHSVTKPIIQEVREIITPQRKIVQEIQPVQEHVTTIVAKSDQQPQQAARAPAPAPAPAPVRATPALSSPVSSTGFLGSSRPLGRSLGAGSLGKSGSSGLGSLGATKGGY